MYDGWRGIYLIKNNILSPDEREIPTPPELSEPPVESYYDKT